MNSMPGPWSDAKHIVNSSKTAQTTETGDHLQICDSLYLQVPLQSVPYTWRLIYLCTVTRLKRDVAWIALHRGPVQQRVPAHGFLLCLFFFVSHALGHRRGLLQKLFPEPKCLCGLCIYNRSPTVFRPRDYETPSGSRASALMTEKGSWPWHPEQKSTPEFSQSSSFFFPAPSPTLSYHLKPEYFSPYAGVKQIHQNTQTQTSHIAKTHYRLKQRQQIKGTPQQVNFLD